MSHNAVIHAYGLFMIAWSVLETVIEAAIMKELQISPPKAIILTTSMQFRQRVSVLSSLLELSGEDHADAIKLLKKIERDARRNMLVHGHIIVGVPGQLTFVKSNITDGYGAKRAAFTAPELHAHIQRLTGKTDKLQALLNVTDSDIQSIADIGISASVPTP